MVKSASFCIFLIVLCTVVWSKSLVRRQRQTSLDLLRLNPIDIDQSLTEQSAMDLPWEKLIINGPMTVNLLGQLMVVATRMDFSFLDFAPKTNITYMKYPQSFRATLLQISNEGWQAFLTAHSNMLKIQLFMESVPMHIKTAFKVLNGSSTSPNLLNILPRTLQQIENIGKDCVTISAETHQVFLDVMNLLGEVISMTELARGLQQTRLKETEIALNVSRVMAAQLKSFGETAERHLQEARESVQIAQREFSTALRKIPSGFGGMIRDMARALINVINVFTRTISSGQYVAPKAQVQTVMANGEALAYSKLFKDGLDGLSKAVNSLFPPSGNMKNLKDPIDELDGYRISFEQFQKALGTNSLTTLKEKTVKMLDEGIVVAGGFLAATKEIILNNKQVNVSSLRSRLSALIAEVSPMALAEGNQQKESVKRPSFAGGSSSKDNEVMIARLAQGRLTDAHNHYDRAFTELQSQQEQMGKLMSRIASLDLTRINYLQLLEILRDALLLLGNIREQWNQLVLFFSEIASRAEIALTASLGPFIYQAKQAGIRNISTEDRMLYIELLKGQALEIHQQSHMLFLMSRTYVDMSKEHLMPRLASLTKMLSTSNDPERTRLLNQLKQETDMTQNQVKQIVQERKTMYSNAVSQRQAELERFVQQMGGLSQTDLRVIAEAQQISAGIS